MTVSSLFPSSLLGWSDVGGEVRDFQTLHLSGVHADDVTTLTCVEAIPSDWPSAGEVTVGRNERVKYTGKGTYTLTGCTRAYDAPVNGAGDAQQWAANTTVELALGARNWNQAIAELIAIEKNLGGNWRSIVEDGAVAGGATDAVTAFNTAVATVSAAGGGNVFVPPGDYVWAGTFVPKINVTVIAYGARITWTGSAGGQMIENDNTESFAWFNWFGGTFDPDGSAHWVKLHSAISCRFRDIRILASSDTSVGIYLLTDGNGDLGTTNSMRNVFECIDADVFGTAFKLEGASSSSVVTLNRFTNVDIGQVKVMGLDDVKWSDNNRWAHCRWDLRADNAIGVTFNTDSAGANRGVYGEQFEHCAIDAFGSHTGRKMIVLNYSKEIRFVSFFNGSGGSTIPTVNMGTDDTNAVSYWIEDLTGSNDQNSRILAKGVAHVIKDLSGVGPTWNPDNGNARQSWNTAGNRWEWVGTDNAYKMQVDDAAIRAPIPIDSQVTTGTAPFIVASTTKVSNLNVDLLDDLTSADFARKTANTAIAARVRYTAGAQTATTGVTLTLTYDTEDTDTDTIHDNATNPSRLTCKTAGHYRIYAAAEFASNATGIRVLHLLLNGSTYIGITQVDANAGGATIVSVETEYTLAVNDYLEVVAYQNSGGNLNINTNGSHPYTPVFGMSKIA